jgi:L-lactate dehydrogenase
MNDAIRIRNNLAVTNMVDLFTSLAQKLSRLPTSQVLGSGTFLDPVRLRELVAHKTGVCIHQSSTY